MQVLGIQPFVIFSTKSAKLEHRCVSILNIDRAFQMQTIKILQEAQYTKMSIQKCEHVQKEIFNNKLLNFCKTYLKNRKLKKKNQKNKRIEN